MDGDIGFNVPPGVRLVVQRRGPRISTGPRMRRIDTAGSELIDGIDPQLATEFSRLSGGGHAAPAPRSTSRRRRRGEGWQSQRHHLQKLTHAHLEVISRAGPPEPPPPAILSEVQVRKDLRRQAAAATPWWRIVRRRAAWREADGRLQQELIARNEQRQLRHTAACKAAQTWWTSILELHEPTLLHHLDVSFRDHALSATAVASTQDTVHVVLPADTPERLVGKREPTANDRGTHSMTLMSRPRRHDLYVEAICSAIVTVAAEIFAVSPNTRVVVAAVAVPNHPAGPSIIALAKLTREELLPRGHDRPAIDDLRAAAQQDRAILILERLGQATAPRPLLRSRDRAVEALLAALDVR